ncbi:MAG: DUF4261 domain-containing protein [Acetatifactor sp.]|nr:DUF4261 domain-containing protein [Acetatifactor sp.]
MSEQRKYAAAVMEEWLSHPQELGKKPARLEIAGEFDLHDLHYYIFKFKKSVFDSWRVAVCGGYEGDSLGHCGHIYSEMEPYDPSTAQEKCVAMVEKLRQYWMERANEQEGGDQNTSKQDGGFVGFVLLSTPEFDVQRFRTTLKEDWGIDCPESSEGSEASEDQGTALVFSEDGMMVTVGLMEVKIPDGEAEYWANSNFMTREQSVAAAQNHQAHLLVAVLDRSEPLRAGELFVKVASACLKASNALGIYDCGTVWLPEDYIRSAMVMKDGEFPLTDLVFVGLYQNEKGVSSWTNGLRSFGKEELEVIESSQSPSEVYELMFNISSYLIQEGAVLRDGETLGYTAEQKLPIKLSQGVYVEGQSLKIGF